MINKLQSLAVAFHSMEQKDQQIKLPFKKGNGNYYNKVKSLFQHLIILFQKFIKKPALSVRITLL